MELLFQLAVPAALLLLGLIAGKTTERLHFRRLGRREEALPAMTVTDLKTFPGGSVHQPAPTLVVAEVVIANDYLKSFLAAIRKIIGGEVGGYLTLMERARREAVLRVLERAARDGYDSVCNLRLETASIGSMAKKGAAMVGVIASGTAYCRSPGGTP